MNDPEDAAENPFATRHIRPGALGYRFRPGESVERLVQRLAENHWRGEIVGPHGSGKSSLLAAILPQIDSASWAVALVVLRDGQRRLPRPLPSWSPGERQFLAIDGFEQLSRFRRWCIRLWARRRHAGLLVTSHHAVGLPRLATTEADFELAMTLVDELLAGRPLPIARDKLEERFWRHKGNVRAWLLELYDVWEAGAR